jgi:rsbT co-antagonist protein RsbR
MQERPPGVVSVELPRIERIHDLLAAISLDEYDPAVDRLPIEHDDRFAALEETINLFARPLDATVREHRATISQLEASRRELADKLETIDRQRAAIRDLSTPVVEVWDDILALPIVGLVDDERARETTAALLEQIARTRARCVIIDLTGVASVDTAIAGHFLGLVGAARLVGAYCVITGISPAVAETITHIGVDLSGIRTLSSLKAGLRACLDHLAARRRG